RYYQFPLNDEYLGDIQLQLDRAGKYLIISESAIGRGTGIFQIHYFSSGSYAENANSVVLTDKHMGYRFELSKKNNKLKCRKCFPFLRHGVFKYIGSNIDSLFWARAIRLTKDPVRDS